MDASLYKFMLQALDIVIGLAYRYCAGSSIAKIFILPSGWALTVDLGLRLRIHLA